MKKYIYKFEVLLVTVFMLGACNDDFLERFPLDEVSNDTFWNTANDLATYNNFFYHMVSNDTDIPIMLGHDNGFNSLMVSYLHVDGFADNLAPDHERHRPYQQVRAGKHIVPTQSSGINDQWYGFRGWNFVRAINVGLENYGKANIPENIRNRYIGEARLFRGWFYHHMVKMFGDAPYVDRELNIDSDELFASRTPRVEVMNKVLEDLNFAVASIPNDWGDGNNPGRLNRWAALAIKSRVCLFEGTWRKYHGLPDADMWLTEAANAAKDIMDNGPHSIYSTGNPSLDYNSFHRGLADLTGNPEVIIWRRYRLGILNNHVQSYYSYTGGATRNVVEDFLCTDGLPITLSNSYQGDDVFENIFVNRDPRLRQTVLHPDDAAFYKYHNADGLDYPRIAGMPGGRTSSTGYHVIKHYNADDQIGKAFNTGEFPALIMRYAEVLLNYAEAKAELGEITQADLDMSINLLRERVAMPAMGLNPPMDPRYADDGISSLLVEIRRERRIELFGEGFRYDDLRRWKQGKKLLKKDMGIQWNAAHQDRFENAIIKTSVDPDNGKTYIDVYKDTDWDNPVFDESKDYLWPIPLNDLAQNPALGQNPGWN
ncbi:RagB/SusD family nutrient uptake outer membrane protein [Lunatibacter salilacus]|uniref:RagB/SusD family nutrient uptake outer membrane protein n=1 Tax=Lunatibacter salilacus TaxID=2483804 RepID=UPI00131AE532|nr:RagB/SusD family nutrient uptake outer membrane protein [Lunatibacter salilacus]